MWYIFAGLAALILYGAFRKKKPEEVEDFYYEIRPLNPQPVYNNQSTQTDPQSPMKLIRDEPTYYFSNGTKEKQNKQQ